MRRANVKRQLDLIYAWRDGEGARGTAYGEVQRPRARGKYQGIEIIIGLQKLEQVSPNGNTLE